MSTAIAYSLLVGVSLSFANIATAQAPKVSSYVLVRLPQGVILRMPRNWRVLTDDSRITLEAATEALESSINAESLPSTLPFAASYYDGNRATAGMLNVRYYPENTVTQSDVRSMLPSELKALDGELRSGLSSSAKASGNKLLEWRGTKAVDIDGLRFLVSEYRRSSPRQKSFRVRLVRLLDGARSLTVTVSYREDEHLLGPITDHMISTLQLSRDR